MFSGLTIFVWYNGTALAGGVQCSRGGCADFASSLQWLGTEGAAMPRVSGGSVGHRTPDGSVGKTASEVSGWQVGAE